MSEDSKPQYNHLSRLDWANLNWKDAQHKIATILNKAGFMKFEERTLTKSNRADVVVTRSVNNYVIFGIIEVKSYKMITTKIAKNAIIQSCRYVTALYNISKNNKRWGNKQKRYFAAVVFTNDYPDIIFNPNVKQFSDYLPSNLVKHQRIELIICVPEKLIKILQTRGYATIPQNTLDEYF